MLKKCCFILRLFEVFLTKPYHSLTQPIHLFKRQTNVFRVFREYAVTADVKERKSFAERGFTGALPKPSTVDAVSRHFN